MMSNLPMASLFAAPWFAWTLLPIGYFFLWRGVSAMRRTAPAPLVFTMGLCEFCVGAAATWFGVTLG